MNQKTRWMYPQAQENQLNRILSMATTEMISAMRAASVRLKRDSAEDVEREEGELDGIIEALVASVVSALPAIGFAIYKYNTSQFLKVARNSGARNNAYIILLGTMEPSQADEVWISARNNWLIQSRLSSRKLLNNIKDDFIQRKLQEESGITPTHSDAERYRVYRNKTANIAAAITSSLNSSLMRKRLEDAGVTSYFWHGMLDERERPSHIAREGKEYPFNSTDVFPGQEWGCRCWAVPNWSKQEDE